MVVMPYFRPTPQPPPCPGLGADLVVMGAYSHSRLKELLLGGVTQHVLENATLPVLMMR